MLWTIVVVLLELWALGFFVANLGSVIHLVLVIALIAIIWNFVKGRGATA